MTTEMRPQTTSDAPDVGLLLSDAFAAPAPPVLASILVPRSPEPLDAPLDAILTSLTVDHYAYPETRLAPMAGASQYGFTCPLDNTTYRTRMLPNGIAEDAPLVPITPTHGVRVSLQVFAEGCSRSTLLAISEFVLPATLQQVVGIARREGGAADYAVPGYILLGARGYRDTSVSFGLRVKIQGGVPRISEARIRIEAEDARRIVEKCKQLPTGQIPRITAWDERGPPRSNPFF